MARSPDERDPAAGIGRPGGILVAALTAAIIFVIGQQLLPLPKKAAPPPPPPPPPVPEVAPPPPPPPPPPRVEVPVPVPVPAAPPPTPPPARVVLDPQQKLERDIARESWRKNAPDIRVADDKASIVIPIKGSIADASSKVIKRTRTVVVTLPKATSLNTRKFYKLGADGFRQLWVEQEEINPDPANGTTLKIVLTDSVGPLIEIKDDFVRVTIPRQAPPPAAEKEAAPPPPATTPPATPDASARD